MTRFFVTKSCEETISVLCSLLDKHHYTWNVDAAGAVSVITIIVCCVFRLDCVAIFLLMFLDNNFSARQ